eukprot:scaffold3605_cov430-Prasinococcus_capsulatus_cf.AAC.9
MPELFVLQPHPSEREAGGCSAPAWSARRGRRRPPLATLPPATSADGDAAGGRGAADATLMPRAQLCIHSRGRGAAPVATTRRGSRLPWSPRAVLRVALVRARCVSHLTLNPPPRAVPSAPEPCSGLGVRPQTGAGGAQISPNPAPRRAAAAAALRHFFCFGRCCTGEGGDADDHEADAMMTRRMASEQRARDPRRRVMDAVKEVICASLESVHRWGLPAGPSQSRETGVS